MILIFNSTPLIYLAKVGLLPLIGNLPYEKLTTFKVKEEVVDKGKEIAAKDAFIIEKNIREETIKVEEIVDKKFFQMLLKIPELHESDAQVLAMAKEKDGIAIVDDRIARETARIYGIKCKGTPFILALLVIHKIIAKKEAKTIVNDIVSLGWRCSAEQYSKIIAMIDEI
ncbi:MAG: DUF3368 domain-containing protein [Euryarchaeota archaeon]|nr:DUF3368 domain-containing protein [Euryarchaeota archaeon]